MFPRVDHGCGVNGQLQVYMECVATSLLLDLVIDCFNENLLHPENDFFDAAFPSSPARAAAREDAEKTCLRVLIEVSDRCGEQFDWVVGHLGGKYPSEIIPQILVGGLRVHYAWFEKMQNHASQSDGDSSVSGGTLTHRNISWYCFLCSCEKPILPNSSISSTPFCNNFEPYFSVLLCSWLLGRVRILQITVLWSDSSFKLVLFD